MNKTEKVALREAVIVVMMGAVINFPLQTFLLWLTIDNWQWSIYSNHTYFGCIGKSFFNKNEISKRKILKPSHSSFHVFSHDLYMSLSFSFSFYVKSYPCTTRHKLWNNLKLRQIKR